MAKVANNTANTDTGEIMPAGGLFLNLNPADIKWTETTNVRPWEEKGDEHEQKLIADLARSIVTEGQLQNIVVRELDGGVYEGIAGRRRTAAVLYAIETLKHTDLRVKALVLQNIDDEAAYRKALTENFKRKNMSAMDMALNIVEMRTRMHLETDPEWSKKIAQSLGGVSRAFVTQKVKLLETLDAEHQKQVHEGILSEEAALALGTKLKSDADKKAIGTRATELAKEEQARKDAGIVSAADVPETGVVEGASTETGGEAGTGADTPVNDSPTVGETKLERKGKVSPVQERHVVVAAREADALDKPTPLTRREIVELIEQFDSPVFGHPNGDIRKWVNCFMDCVKGTGKMATFKRLFGKMVDKAEKGTPEPKKEAKADADAKGKPTTATAKGKPEPSGKGSGGKGGKKAA